MEEHATRPEAPHLKLRLRDFNLGHYPDTKEPPWGIHETAWGYPAIAEALARADEIAPGEEKFICNAEANFGDRVVPVKISIWKNPDDPALLYVRATPL